MTIALREIIISAMREASAVIDDCKSHEPSPVMRDRLKEADQKLLEAVMAIQREAGGAA